jgi:hypothetical protein
MGTTHSLLWTGALVWTLGLAAAYWLPETYGRDLDHVE